MSTSTRTNRLMPSDTGTSPSRAGKQIKCSAATLKAALELQATLKADILRGEHRQGHTVTFAEYAREWVESYQGRTTRGFREATRSEYRRSVEKAIPWFAGHCPKLSDAEPRDMRLYVAWLQKDGRALSTVRNHFNVIRAMFATQSKTGCSGTTRARASARRACRRGRP